jgi:hypothetical protein
MDCSLALCPALALSTMCVPAYYVLVIPFFLKAVTASPVMLTELCSAHKLIFLGASSLSPLLKWKSGHSWLFLYSPTLYQPSLALPVS